MSRPSRRDRKKKRNRGTRKRADPEPLPVSSAPATAEGDRRSAGDTGPGGLRRALDLPERPGRITAGLLFLAIIVFGYEAAPQLADPATVSGAWEVYSNGLWAAVAFGATATLTTLAYCLVFFRDVEPTRKFLTWVAQYAGIGAILGTLLGCRMALPLVIASKQPGGQAFTFSGFLGMVSNTATMLTLLMIATCWIRMWGVVSAIARANAAETPVSRWRFVGWVKTTALVVVTVGVSNLVGLRAANAVLVMLG